MEFLHERVLQVAEVYPLEGTSYDQEVVSHVERYHFLVRLEPETDLVVNGRSQLSLAVLLMPTGCCCGSLFPLSQLMEETFYPVKIISTLFLPVGNYVVTAMTAGKPNDKFCLSST